MNAPKINSLRLLRISSGLLILGLILEVVTLVWFHPLSFVLFAFVAAALIGLGILIYLAALALMATPPAGDRG
jgi:hypothetical protein